MGIHKNIVNDKIKVFCVNNRVEIRSEEAITAMVIIYNMMGQRIAKIKMYHQKSASVRTGNYKGIAVVSIINNNMVTTKKIVMR